MIEIDNGTPVMRQRPIIDPYSVDIHIYIPDVYDRSITHSLQRSVSTKYSISQLECILNFIKIQ